MNPGLEVLRDDLNGVEPLSEAIRGMLAKRAATLDEVVTRLRAQLARRVPNMPGRDGATKDGG